MKKPKILILSVVAALSLTAMNANASTDVATKEKGAELEYLTKMAHMATDTPIFYCKAKEVKVEMTNKQKADTETACKYEGLKSLAEFSMCAVYDNKENINSKRTDECYNYVINKYAGKFKDK
ncbi:hypothetical protein E1N66_18785 [Pantoea allii]|nr:hypothetical protein [Pantoea allii]THB82850.1 hypothetical protein E1N66_18785 [Pantoea allii]